MEYSKTIPTLNSKDSKIRHNLELYVIVWNIWRRLDTCATMYKKTSRVRHFGKVVINIVAFIDFQRVE